MVYLCISDNMGISFFWMIVWPNAIAMQEELPALTEQGEIILETRTHPAMAPNGNGGLYSALIKWEDSMPLESCIHMQDAMEPMWHERYACSFWNLWSSWRANRTSDHTLSANAVHGLTLIRQLWPTIPLIQTQSLVDCHFTDQATFSSEGSKIRQRHSHKILEAS